VHKCTILTEETCPIRSGFWFASPIESFPDSQWNLQVSAMLTAPFHLIKRCLPAMKAKGKEREVNSYITNVVCSGSVIYYMSRLLCRPAPLRCPSNITT